MEYNNQLSYGLNAKQLDEAKDKFHAYESNNSGTISVCHLSTLLYLAHRPHSYTQLQSILKQANINESGPINLEEYLKIAKELLFTEKITRKMMKQSDEAFNEAKDYFYFYDLKRSGFISINDLKILLLRAYRSFILTQLPSILEQAGINENGPIEIEEYLKIAKKLLFNTSNL
ncbi:EF-hand [Neoconidiobolus thromboides FSU 785]|nr:EF-hand [Neoconidiobolus thromboides FSU 785]